MRCLEALGAKQRNKQIGAECERNDETKYGFEHRRLRHSRPTASAYMPIMAKAPRPSAR